MTTPLHIDFLDLVYSNDKIYEIFNKHKNNPVSRKFLKSMGFDVNSTKTPFIDGCNDFQASLALVIIEYETKYPNQIWGAKGAMFHFYMEFYYIPETNQQWFPFHKRDGRQKKYWSYDKNTDHIAAERFQQEFYNVIKKFTHHALTTELLSNPTLLDKKNTKTKHLFTSHRVVLTIETKRRFDAGEDLRGSRGIGWSIHHKGPVPKIPRDFSDIPCVHEPGKAPKPKVTETDLIRKIVKKKEMTKQARKDVITIAIQIRDNLQNGVPADRIQADIAARTVQSHNHSTNMRATTFARRSVELF